MFRLTQFHLLLYLSLVHSDHSSSSLVVLTVPKQNESSLQRYLNSADVAGLKVKVLGSNEPRKNNLEKLKLVKSELERILKATNQDSIVMYTNSETSLLLGSETQIINNFKATKTRVLFSDTKVISEQSEQQLSKADGFIGYASSLQNLLQHLFNETNNTVYPSDKIRYDTKASVFQQLGLISSMIGSCSRPRTFWEMATKNIRIPPHVGCIELKFVDDKPRIVNTLHATQPSVLIGGSSPTGMSVLNYFANYLIAPGSHTLRILPKTETELPTVFMAVFIPGPYPFLERFFQNIFKMEYPKSKIRLRIYNATSYGGNYDAITKFMQNYSSSYAGLELIDITNLKVWEVRNAAVAEALTTGCDYYFNVDAGARLTNPNILKLLMEQNRTVISPLLTKPYKSTNSNFWGALNRWGRRTRAWNNEAVTRQDHKGIWNVPCISEAYLVKSAYLPSLKYTRENNEVFCTSEFDGKWPFHLTNEVRLGYRVTNEGFRTDLTHTELYQVRLNRYDWELSYLHPEWKKFLDSKESPVEPCRDVYWFPLVTPLFCTHMIQLMEANGNWTAGTNYNGTAEDLEKLNDDPFPTVDIDVSQIGFHIDWHDIARSYITPLRRKVFGGFVPDPPYIDTTFVIRYKPEEQSSNKPHHDYSTVTINMALNLPEADYTGGGCRFLRHNCSVTDARLGWILMHPGALTHYHEGMSTTSGTRYILVSFIDPPIDKKQSDTSPSLEPNEEDDATEY